MGWKETRVDGYTSNNEDLTAIEDLPGKFCIRMLRKRNWNIQIFSGDKMKET